MAALGCQTFLSLDTDEKRGPDAGEDASSTANAADAGTEGAADGASDGSASATGIVVREVKVWPLTSTGTVTFDRPSRVREGDLLFVMIDGHEASGKRPEVDASVSFQNLALLEAQGPGSPCGIGGDTHAFYVAMRRTTSSEPSKYDFTLNDVDKTSGVITVFGGSADDPVDRSWSQERILVNRDGGNVSRYVTASMQTLSDDTLLVFAGFDMGGGKWTMTDPVTDAAVGTTWKDDAFIGLFTEPFVKKGAVPERSLNLTSLCDSNGAYFVMALRPK